MQIKNNLCGDKLRKEIELIESCINAMPEHDYNIMVAVFIEKITLRQVAKNVCLSHSGVRKRIQKLLKTIIIVYESAF